MIHFISPAMLPNAAGSALRMVIITNKDTADKFGSDGRAPTTETEAAIEECLP